MSQQRKYKMSMWIDVVPQLVGAMLGSSVFVALRSDRVSMRKMISMFWVGAASGYAVGPVLLRWADYVPDSHSSLFASALAGTFGYLVLSELVTKGRVESLINWFFRNRT